MFNNNKEGIDWDMGIRKTKTHEEDAFVNGFWIRKELHAELKAMADKYHCSIVQAVRMAIILYLRGGKEI